MTSHTTEATEARSVTDLLKELRDETTLLVRQEVALAKTELSEKASRVGRNTGTLATGGLVAYAGLIFVLLAVTVGVGIGLDAAGLGSSSAWLAPLIVGVVVGIIGWTMMKSSLHTLSNETLVPEKTIDSLKEDKQWAQNKLT